MAAGPVRPFHPFQPSHPFLPPRMPIRPPASPSTARPLWRTAGSLLLAWLAAGATAAPRPAERPVVVCFDADSHSVHRYRDAKGRWQGAAMELTRAAFERSGYRVEWQALPWARCQRDSRASLDAQGEPVAPVVEVVMFASRSAARDRDWWATLPLHRDLGGVWYSRRHLPDGPRLASRADLRRFTLCGRLGGNFEWLKAHGVPDVAHRPLSVQAGLRMVEKGHCALFLFTREAVQGAARQRLLVLPASLAFEPYPDEALVSQHLMVARASPRAAQLVQDLNAALQQLHAEGVAERIYRHHQGSGTGFATGSRLPGGS